MLSQCVKKKRKIYHSIRGAWKSLQIVWNSQYKIWFFFHPSLSSCVECVISYHMDIICCLMAVKYWTAYLSKNNHADEGGCFFHLCTVNDSSVCSNEIPIDEPTSRSHTDFYQSNTRHERTSRKIWPDQMSFRQKSFPDIMLIWLSNEHE